MAVQSAHIARWADTLLKLLTLASSRAYRTRDGKKWQKSALHHRYMTEYVLKYGNYLLESFDFMVELIFVNTSHIIAFVEQTT